MNLSWDEHHLLGAFFAASKSRDDSTKCGCVIVGVDNEVRSTGYNGLARGVEYKKERMERPTKYYWFSHSERNAIYNAAMMGIALKNCTIYVTNPPCSDCAIAIINSKISRVVIPEYGNTTGKLGGSKWKESCGIANEMFKEANVQYDRINITEHMAKIIKLLGIKID